MKNNTPYSINLVFNKKDFTINIILDRIVNGKPQCDFEIFTNEKMTGFEFQKIKKYLEDEGYIEEAIKHSKRPLSK
jgi:hypothetical protein